MSQLSKIIHTEVATIEEWIKRLEVSLGLIAPPNVVAAVANIKAAAPTADNSAGTQAPAPTTGDSPV